MTSSALHFKIRKPVVDAILIRISQEVLDQTYTELWQNASTAPIGTEIYHQIVKTLEKEQIRD